MQLEGSSGGRWGRSWGVGEEWGGGGGGVGGRSWWGGGGASEEDVRTIPNCC